MQEDIYIIAAFSESMADSIDANNTMAFELLRYRTHRQEIRDVIRDVTGKVYNLGPYRPPENGKEVQDPMQQFKEALSGSGIKVEEN